MPSLTTKLPWEKAQALWASVLNPIIGNPITSPTLITDIELIEGVNIINHGLGQLQQGWIITDIQGSANVYRSEPFNTLTLTLTSSALVTISLAVF